MSSSVRSPFELEYPGSDGTPMAASAAQGIPLRYPATGLRDCFRDRHDGYVSGNPGRRPIGAEQQLGHRHGERSAPLVGLLQKIPAVRVELARRSPPGARRSLYRRGGFQW